MTERKRVLLLIFIMGVVAVTVGGCVLTILYRAAFEQQSERLHEVALSKARFIEAVARFNWETRKQNFPDDMAFRLATLDTLTQVSDAHARFAGFGETGEFTLARRDGDNINFLISHRWHDLDKPFPVALDSRLAQPMQAALNGRSGLMTGLDYRGEVVLAAFEPIDVLDWGVVAKMDLNEVRKPFVQAGAAAGGLTLLLVLAGATLFLRVGNPLIRKLEENERKFRLLFERSSDAHVVSDQQLFIDCNQAALRMLGLDNAEQLLGRRPADFSPTQQPDGSASDLKAKEMVAECQAIGHHRFDWTFRKLNGEVVLADVLLNAITLGGRPAVHAVWRDVTELRQAERKLEQHRRDLERIVDERTAALESAHQKLIKQERLATLGQLTATVSHELRNPLGTIRSSVFTIRERLTDPDSEMTAVIGRAERNIVRCDEIIEELLDYTRTRQINFVATQVDDWVERFVSDCQLPADIELDLRLNAPVEVRLDPEKMRRCLINLVNNACQAMSAADAPARLTLETRLAGERLEISVRDTGPGVAADQLEKVFEPLFSTKSFGVGLGLPIVRQIAEAHGGGVSIANDRLGGAVAMLWLPMEPCPIGV